MNIGKIASCPVCGERYLEPMPYDYLKASDDTTTTTQSTVYVKIKELSVPTFLLRGKIRVMFTLSTNNPSFAAYGQLYMDGVPGTEYSTTDIVGVVFTEDIPVTPTGPSKIELYIRSGDATVVATNVQFRIYAKARCALCGYEDSMRVRHAW